MKRMSVAEAEIIERAVLAGIEQRSAARVAELDRLDAFEPLVEPATAFARVASRFFLALLAQTAHMMLGLERQIKDFTPSEPVNSEQAKVVREMVGVIENLQRHMEVLYSQMQDQRARSADPEVLAMAGHVLRNMQSVYDALEARRWAAFEAEADADITAGRVKKFGNAAAAIAHLRRSARKK